MKTTFRFLVTACFAGMCAVSQAQVRINQVAMYPQQQKTAVVEGKVAASKVVIRNAKTGKKVVSTKLLRVATSPWSGKQRTVVDFSRLTTPGSYVVECNGDQLPFEVKENALRDVTKGAIKAFYYQRTGMPIEAKYAGKWARPAGHPDTQVMIHSSAVSPGRPEGTIISSPYGWYDAGDYNKYIVNSAFTIAVMLDSYEQNKAYYDALEVNIPESGNQTADLLDEIMYNLKWMLTMQDPYDGGVYHKLTTPNFEGFVMPSACKQQRYVVQKSVTAAYDFAAVMAQAARIYKDNKDYPHFSAHATSAALAAYNWAENHPNAHYFQDRMNRTFKPAVSTGTYGDFSAKDERFWAATELYLLTHDEVFAQMAVENAPNRFTIPVWGSLATLGSFAWMAHAPEHELAQRSKQQLLVFCDSVISTTATSSFQTPNGNNARDFGWGCLAECFGAGGMALLYAYQQTGNGKYLTAALQNAEYILGRNATGYCYVTGFGSKPTMNPHHRLSAADGIEDPIPGFLAGGPNPGQQDKASNISYPSNQPDESYADVTESYASNEIAINWNGCLVGLFGWLDAVEK